jgi:hypothetical protein
MIKLTPSTNKFLTSGIWLSIALDQHIQELEKHAAVLKGNKDLEDSIVSMKTEMKPFISSLRTMLGEYTDSEQIDTP